MNTNSNLLARSRKRKTLFFMKNVILFMLISTLNISASNSYSQQVKLSMELNNSSLKEVLKEIKKQTEFSVLYRSSDVKNVNGIKGDFKEATVMEILDCCLKGTKLAYEVKDRVIVIHPLAKNPEPVNQKARQERKNIKGKVLDDSGQSLPGVSVVVKGTLIGVSTDADGNFSLNLPESGEVLVISFIGMATREINIAGKTYLEVVLQPDQQELTEVVVTGYGARLKDSYTGAATTIEGDELLQTNSTNLLLALQTVDPSFVMIEDLESGSNPNVLPDFQIRGSSSLSGLESDYKGKSNMPLFMLDGFETDATTIFDMDPQRVKSLTILKDASATAIYGSRGANGVVVVETYAPQKGKVKVSYNADLSLTVADLTAYNLLNAKDKLALEWDAGHYATKIDIAENYHEKLLALYNSKRKAIEEGVDTYWLSKPLEDQLNHKHSVNLEGGDDVFRYGMNLSYHKNEGVMIGSGRDRYNINLTLQYRVDNFTFKNSMTYYNINSTNSPYGTFIDYARLNPYNRYKGDDGEILFVVEKDEYGHPKEYNPMYDATLNVVDKTQTRNFRNNFAVDWNINENSTLKGSISFTQETQLTDVFKPAKHTDFAGYNYDEADRRGSYQSGDNTTSLLEASLTYTYMMRKDKNLFYFSTTGNIKEEKYDSYSIVAEGFPSEDMDHIKFAKQYHKDLMPDGSEYTARSLGWLGTFNYSYDNRYFADLSYRFDASSRFGADSRWAPFGSVGIGWNVHNEDFFDDSKLVNRLKLIASYGISGSQDFDPHQALTTYQLYDHTMYHYGYGFLMKGLGNENLKWQRTLKANFGFEADLFEDRLNLTANIYNDLSKDALVPVSLPTSLGFASYTENLGEIENRGYELRARLRVLKKQDVNLSVFASAVHNKNTLKKLSNALQAINSDRDNELESGRDQNGEEINMNRPKVRYIEGESTNTIWAVQSLGIDPTTGKEVYLNQNGDKTYTWSSNDQIASGCRDADLTGNFGSNFFYKGFSMNMIFTYRLGGEMYNQTLVDRVENANLERNVDRRVFEGRWRKPGDQAVFKDVKDLSQTKPTTRFVEKYNYLNLSSVNFAYNFNVTKLPLERLKLMFTMNDIFRASSVEVERGLNYPFARTFTFTLQSTF